MLSRKPRAVFIGDDEMWCEESITASEVHDDGPPDIIDTGLLDAYGQPIYRSRRAVKFGFVP
jgi:hypothetical protein